VSEGHPNVEVAHFSTNVASPSSGWWRQVRGDLGDLEGVALAIERSVFGVGCATIGSDGWEVVALGRDRRLRNMSSKTVLTLSALLELAMGLALIVTPGFVTHLLLGVAVTGTGIATARVGGFGLLSLGVACWPPQDATGYRTPLRALLIYNLLATLYLSWLGIKGEWVGRALWPAAVGHAAMTILLARNWLNARGSQHLHRRR
jgi:hypothetical protein